MKKGIVKTVQINPEVIKSNIKAAGYSLRSLAPVIGVDRRMIMNWLKKGEMPEYLLKLIDDEVRPKKKEIWMRVGMTVRITEDELFELMEAAHHDHCVYYDKFASREGLCDYEVALWDVDRFMRNATIDGETYIPGICLQEHTQWWLEERKRRGIQ